MRDFDIGEELKRIEVSVLLELVKRQHRVLISDTTLRDGEQAPGASLSITQKLIVAKQLETLGVDAIEAGFPASSREEFDAVRLISRELKKPVISALARCHAEDIRYAAEALEGARHCSISLFLGTSPILRQYSLGKSSDEVIATLREAIKCAKKYTDRVAFGAEDATRTERQFLYRVYEEAIDAGAAVIGFPDTVGCLVPEQVKEIVKGIKENVRNIGQAFLAAHFHNDLGLAVANSLAAIQEGVSIVQCTVNGIGERAGNTSLEELVMALKTHKDFYGVRCNVNTKELYKTSRLVEEMTGISMSPNKAIVGKNVFATEAGIHQAALLKSRTTYEIIDPADVGREGTTLILGRHSGKHAVYDRLQKIGFCLGGDEYKEQREAIYRKFKEVAATKKEINDSELSDIAQGVLERK